MYRTDAVSHDLPTCTSKHSRRPRNVQYLISSAAQTKSFCAGVVRQYIRQVRGDQ